MSLSTPVTTPLALVTERRKLREWRLLFTRLPTPTRDSLPGRYRAELLGPAWFQGFAHRLLGVLGMRGWWGKDIAPGGREGANLVNRVGGVWRAVPLVLREGTSRVDGRTSLQVEYTPEVGWQWRPFVDELRWLEGRTLLAMTHLELPVLRRLTFPFLLHREPSPA
ncbi:hypothetical protein HUA74_27485 [Myxococcus sp. CA051A]|nr:MULTISPECIES: hypothetical protein [unclassified Myxococcus]NTX09942.1 hypothetical protein [Myxococcus sp. CA056]NTX35305.1 hypothetical protein [Myxococcus sp. CA033]NTX64404.1 hypothetical protein [Myxococcus sp. CA051A]